jgi:hypothetical protein
LPQLPGGNEFRRGLGFGEDLRTTHFAGRSTMTSQTSDPGAQWLVRELLRRNGNGSSLGGEAYGSEGWGFESLRARPRHSLFGNDSVVTS